MNGWDLTGTLVADDAGIEAFRMLCERDLRLYPRSEVPQIISRDFASGAADRPYSPPVHEFEE